MSYVVVGILSGIISAALTRWWLMCDVHREVCQIMHDHDVDLVKSLERPYNLEIH